jgi:hypothetical protein
MIIAYLIMPQESVLMIITLLRQAWLTFLVPVAFLFTGFMRQRRSISSVQGRSVKDGLISATIGRMVAEIESGEDCRHHTNNRREFFP